MTQTAKRSSSIRIIEVEWPKRMKDAVTESYEQGRRLRETATKIQRSEGQKNDPQPEKK